MSTLKQRTKTVAGAAFAALALLAAIPDAHAHRGRGRDDWSAHFSIGVPWPHLGFYWSPRWVWGPPPVVYAPPPVYYTPRAYAPPSVYVERDDDRGSPQPPVWWYWCPSERGYHPYVKECPGGWQRVPPQPVPQ